MSFVQRCRRQHRKPPHQQVSESTKQKKPINKQSIGTWRTWGKLPNNIPPNMDNHPENLVILIDFNQKWAYNKFQLQELLESSKTTTIKLPHTSIRHRKDYLIEELEDVMNKSLPIIKIT